MTIKLKLAEDGTVVAVDDEEETTVVIEIRSPPGEGGGPSSVSDPGGGDPGGSGPGPGSSTSSPGGDDPHPPIHDATVGVLHSVKPGNHIYPSGREKVWTFDASCDGDPGFFTMGFPPEYTEATVRRLALDILKRYPEALTRIGA